MKSNYEYNHGIMQQGAIVKLSIYRKISTNVEYCYIEHTAIYAMNTAIFCNI